MWVMSDPIVFFFVIVNWGRDKSVRGKKRVILILKIFFYVHWRRYVIVSRHVSSLRLLHFHARVNLCYKYVTNMSNITEKYSGFPGRDRPRSQSYHWRWFHREQRLPRRSKESDLTSAREIAIEMLNLIIQNVNLLLVHRRASLPTTEKYDTARICIASRLSLLPAITEIRRTHPRAQLARY